VGNIGRNLKALSEHLPANDIPPQPFPLRQAMIAEMAQFENDQAWPLKPQKIIWDLRTALDKDAIAICDVGAHKMWMARFFRAEQPNTCIISNGFASMGIALPGAVGAKLAHPDKAVVAVTGDAGLMMNVQELETALREQTPIVILIWNDSQYGLIEWKQKRRFQRSAYIDFKNPDFVTFAQSFGATGVRIESADQLLPALKTAIATPTVTLIDCPVDYSENDRLTDLLGNVISEMTN
jgi:acetolactate synthase-1/2/3 large subunit